MSPSSTWQYWNQHGKKDQTRCPQDIPTPTCLKPCFILRLWNMHKHFFYALIKQKNCVHFKMCSLLILIQYLICHSILSPPVGVTAFLFFFFFQVDVENPDLIAFPEFSSAVYQECILKEGQMLYIPPYHWHYVRSLSLSFSVSFWWN